MQNHEHDEHERPEENDEKDEMMSIRNMVKTMPMIQKWND